MSEDDNNDKKEKSIGKKLAGSVFALLFAGGGILWIAQECYKDRQAKQEAEQKLRREEARIAEMMKNDPRGALTASRELWERLPDLGEREITLRVAKLRARVALSLALHEPSRSVLKEADEQVALALGTLDALDRRRTRSERTELVWQRADIKRLLAETEISTSISTPRLIMTRRCMNIALHSERFRLIFSYRLRHHGGDIPKYFDYEPQLSMTRHVNQRYSLQMSMRPP